MTEAKLALEVTAALPPCTSAHRVLTFCSALGLPRQILQFYPQTHVATHVKNRSGASALKVNYFGVDGFREKPDSFTCVTVQRQLHLTQRCLLIQSLDDISAPTAVVPSTAACFHRIITSVDMLQYLSQEDRTVHNFCGGLLASLAPGGVCVIFAHEASCRPGPGASDDDDDDIDANKDDDDDESCDSSVDWLFALRSVGFVSTEICYKACGSFVLAARAPSHQSWDIWLSREEPVHGRKAHEKGIVLGSRNALGDRVCHWEEVVHAATLPKAVSATRKKPKVQRVPKIWQLVVQEQKAKFTVPDQRYDFTDLFAGSLKEAAQTIETGRVQIPASGVYVRSASDSRIRGRDTYFHIYFRKRTTHQPFSSDATPLQNMQPGHHDPQSSDRSPEVISGEQEQAEAAFVTNRAAEIEKSIQEAETARMIRAKIAKQMADNPEFAWGLEDSVVSEALGAEASTYDTTATSPSMSGMGEKARRAKERLVSGLKNFTKRFSLDSGKVEDVKHVAKSLKKFYADCGIPKPDEQIIVIAQKFGHQREMLFTNLEQKYRDHGVYKQLWRLKEDLFSGD